MVKYLFGFVALMFVGCTSLADPKCPTSQFVNAMNPMKCTALSAPGPIGGTTSSTGQFTRLAVGASVPTLPGTDGDASINNSLGVGGAADGTAGKLTAYVAGAGTIAAVLGSHTAGSAGLYIPQTPGATLNGTSTIFFLGDTVGNAYMNALTGSIDNFMINGSTKMKIDTNAVTAVAGDVLRVPPAHLATFPACAAGIEGGTATEDNSTAACVNGATATSAGIIHCQMYCNGTNWVQTGL